MNQIDAINIVKDIIQNGLKHKNYQRTVALAKEYRTIITGDGIEDYMKKFPRRETIEEFQQKVDMTVNITETVCGNIIDPQKKLSRSNSIEKTFLYIDNNDRRLNEFESILASFWDNGKGIDDYMSETWVDLNNIDPNALIVIDWKINSEGQRVRPYPIEYMSESVYHYSRVNGVFEWVCIHRDETQFDPEMYIMYAKDFTIIFSRKLMELTWNYKADIHFYKEFPIKDFNGTVAVMKDKDDFWDINIPQPHNVGKVPAVFAGVYRDLSTRETFLSSIHKAMPILKKIVKANSELDLTMALHAYPQKIQYTDPCPDCNGNGKMRDGTGCDVCNGTGNNPKQIHKGALDVLQIPRPRDKEDMFDLSKMIYYVPNDVNLLKFQDDYIDKLTRKCKEAVYNSEVFNRSSVAETAYSKNIDLQNVYDTLWPMAKAYAYTQNFLVDIISRVTDLNNNLVYKISFRKDFKMKSLSDLYNDLKIIGDSNADEFVKKSIEDDIAQVLYEDDTRELKKYNTQNYFFPFNGKNKKEIELIITNPTIASERIRVLWANFSWIFDELEIEFAEKKMDFYMLPRKNQKDALESKIDDLLSKIKKEDINVGTALSEIEQEDRPLQEGVNS
jgi:hypothetical protein